MPSFDVVSELNMQEVDNAVNQTIKEVTTRYDFKGSKTEIKLEKEKIALVSDDDYKMKAVHDMLLGKLIKRGIDGKAIEFGKIEPAANGLVKCDVKLKQGIETEKGKEIVKVIKESKMKVQAQIQDNQVRVSGKSRDDLQEAIALIRGKDFNLPLQFTNFRD